MIPNRYHIGTAFDGSANMRLDEVLHVLNNRNFIFFTFGKKSSLIELTNWLEHNLNACNSFKACAVRTSASPCHAPCNAWRQLSGYNLFKHLKGQLQQNFIYFVNI
ncbi:MAG: hypothetical protein LBL90_11455 [Prevotellaceae bacterium]|nr:hypothetical protein [Prevotellaceae bacterium]